MASPSPSIAAYPFASAWVRLLPDEQFEIFSGKVELGQGISAALRQVACEGLGVLPAQVQLIAGDTARSPDEGYTAGSLSVEVSAAALRHVCQVLRARFAQAAAQALGIDVGALHVAQGKFRCVKGEVSYHQLADQIDLSTLRVDIEAPAAPGTDEVQVKRDDLPAKFSGAGFIHDLTLDGMWHARVLRGPHPGSRPVDFSVQMVEQLPGVERVLMQGDFIAILGRDEGLLTQAHEQACQRITWSVPKLPAYEDAATLLPRLPAVRSVAVEQGQALPVRQSLCQRYSRPYIAHASIGPACALAQPAANGEPLTVWSHTQGAFQLRAQIALALQLPTDQVRVIHTPGAGCYGHNGADDVAFDAALIAHTSGLPVRVQWSRADELTVSPMGSASLIELSAGLDAQGSISHWHAQVWSHTHLARPGWGEGISLLGAWAANPKLQAPAAKDQSLPNGGGLRNVIPAYELSALMVEHHFIAESPVRVSALRSLGAHANVFAIECFMDELSELAGVDPVEFRLRHLKDERARQVIQTVARMSSWQKRPLGGDGTGLGLGFARYKNRSGYCAIVAAVEVTERVRVQKVWACVDTGRIVHRDGLLNQIEGGILQSLSWTLKESVQWNAQGISTGSWDNYPILGFEDVPELEIQLLQPADAPSLGGGEVAAGPCAAALGNAVAHALGLRARHLPLSPERLLGTINQST